MSAVPTSVAAACSTWAAAMGVVEAGGCLLCLLPCVLRGRSKSLESGPLLTAMPWDVTPPAALMRSRNELLGELEIDLMDEVQSASGGDITKTWHLQNVATDWMAAMGLQSE